MNSDIINSDIIKANIEVHTIMSDSYNNEPHFRLENQMKVRSNLVELRSRTGGKLLDLGCGTGFIIHLAVDLFDEIHGIDVTQAMMDKIDLTKGNIKLHNGRAESLPFAQDSFDAVTAYSFIHHVEDYKKILKEAYRVLKPGGSFYIDLEPNKMFWEHISQIDDEKLDRVSEIVRKEVSSVLHTDERVEEQFGISKETFNKAEYIKNILGGIHPHEFEVAALDIGFSSCETKYQWFLGQGKVLHEQSVEAASTIEQYLNETSPMSNHMFKYLRFDLQK